MTRRGGFSNQTSLVIFDLILAMTSDGIPKVLLYCFILTLSVTLAMVFFKLGSMKNTTLKLARRLGLIRGYQLYTICDKEPQWQRTDGTESATNEFKYIATKT